MWRLITPTGFGRTRSNTKTYEGGLAWHGGLIGGVVSAYLYLRYRAK